jgi:Rad3-related DNA helicase
LEKCHDLWSKNNIFDDLKDTKDIIFDIKQSDKNIEEKINKAKNKKNLFLFTVYRGKNSEGINFKDDAARMVICIGIPYPNASDIRVKLKKNFLDEKNEKEDTGYSSKDWYREEAYIAVNQSLGRLIRHKNDYGIMI